MKFEVLATADGRPRHDVTIHRAGQSATCPGICAHDYLNYIPADASELNSEQLMCRHPTCYPGAPDTLGELLAKAEVIRVEILEQNSRDTPALNGLGRRYVDLGLIAEARATFKRVLAVDPTNPIATGRLRELRDGT
jgi:hypothetical protein